MRLPEVDPAKLWLVGGGLAAAWTYGQLARALQQRALHPADSVAVVLLQLTRAVVSGERWNAGEASFGGEGAFRELAANDISLGETTSVEGLTGSADAGGKIALATSGSTAAPRIIQHTAQTLMRAVVIGERHANDIWALAFNPTHIAGVQVYLQALANGNTCVNVWGLDPEAAVERCRRWGVTHVSGTPTFYRLLLATGGTLPSVRSISLGGEPADERLLAGLRQRFPSARLHHIYASTEAGTLFTSEGMDFSPSDTLSGLVRIVDDRLWLHRSLLGRLGLADEWYDTGDQVQVTGSEPLRFRVLGRMPGRINVGGEKVNPEEIESILTSHPRVVVARVFGRRNSVTGQILAADVIARGEAPSERELRSLLQQSLPPHKIPRIIRFVERLDLTRTGKLMRHG